MVTSYKKIPQLVVTLWHFFSHKNPLYKLDWNFILFFAVVKWRKFAKKEKKKENLILTINNDDIVSTN
jgi:hypothetical protein